MGGDVAATGDGTAAAGLAFAASSAGDGCTADCVGRYGARLNEPAEFETQFDLLISDCSVGPPPWARAQNRSASPRGQTPTVRSRI